MQINGLTRLEHFEHLIDEIPNLYDYIQEILLEPVAYEHAGYISLLGYHFDHSCVSFVSTNYFLYSGCSLPSHCGPFNVSQISSTWYGSELLFCHALYTCPSGFPCRHDALHHPYYKLIAPYIEKFPVFNYDYFSLSRFETVDLLSREDTIIIVDNGDTAFIFPQTCSLYTHTLDINKKPHDKIPYNLTSDWRTSCIEARTPSFHDFACKPITKYTHPNRSFRLRRALLNLVTFRINFQNSSYHIPVIKESSVATPPKDAVVIDVFTGYRNPPIGPPFLLTSCFYANLSYLDYTLPIYLGGDCTYLAAEFTDVQCYSVAEHLKNPITLIISVLLNELSSLFSYFFDQLEQEIESILKFFLRLFTKIFSFFFSLLSKIPGFIPFIFTYMFIYYFQRSHVVTLTFTLPLWLLSLYPYNPSS